MNINDKSIEEQEYDKVVDMLSPKYRRKNEFSFPKTEQDDRIKRMVWTISGIAAMVAVVIAFALKSGTTVSATEVINTALINLSEAETFKIDFLFRGCKSSKDEIYRPDMEGELLSGTVYVQRNDGKTLNRIDWHDREKNSIIFNGSKYVHMRNGIKISEHPSDFQDELLSVLILKSLKSLENDKDASITTDGNIVRVVLKKNHKEDSFVFSGDFSVHGNQQLVKATVRVSGPDGKEITMLETKSIQTNVRLPETLFAE